MVYSRMEFDETSNTGMCLWYHRYTFRPNSFDLLFVALLEAFSQALLESEAAATKASTAVSSTCTNEQKDRERERTSFLNFPTLYLALRSLRKARTGSQTLGEDLM